MVSKHQEYVAFKDPVFCGFLFLTLDLFITALLSRSEHPVFLGKSLPHLAITAFFGLSSMIMALIGWKRPAFARILKDILVISLITIALFEVTCFFMARFLPVTLLLRAPAWVRLLLPESAFVRENFRTLTLKERVNDAELGYRTAPELAVIHKDKEVSYLLETDRHGFANADPSLYERADVVVTGDSFVMGATVAPEQSWAQQLAIRSGLRVLNLGTNGWDVYQFPRVLEKYGIKASPQTIIVGLTNYSDLQPRYYEYADYKSTHKEIGGFQDYRLAMLWRETTQVDGNFLSFLMRFIGPFSKTTFEFLTVGTNPQPVSKFTLGGKKMAFYFSTLNHYADKPFSPLLDKVSADLMRIKQIARAKQMHVYYVYFPSPSEIYIPLLKSATHLNQEAREVLSKYKMGAYDLDLYLRYYQQALGVNSRWLLNPTPYLQKYAREGQSLAWVFDFHPNASGHKRIAEFLLPKVCKESPDPGTGVSAPPKVDQASLSLRGARADCLNSD